MPIIGSVLGAVRIVVNESGGLRVLFRDVRSQPFSKGGLFLGESVIFRAFGFILHRPIHEDQNQGMKDMHPWNVEICPISPRSVE